MHSFSKEGSRITALLTGFCLVALLGVFHHFGIIGVRAMTPRLNDRTRSGALVAFLGLLVLHTAEILAFAGFYAWIIDGGWFGTLSGTYSGSWEDLVYFSGINFVTLGYTQIQTDGDIRLISMMQSLGGFMTLTWSATFIYSVWQDAVKEDAVKAPETDRKSASR